MKNFALLVLLAGLCGCASTPKSVVSASACAKTPLQESDMAAYGFTPVPDKIVVMRIFATWCPFCKTDLDKMVNLFKSGKWTAENVNVYLLAYTNHGENKATFTTFMKDKFAGLGFPQGAVQVQFVDKTYADLAKAKSASGDLLFDSWKGLPFGLVFGKDGHLAFRGHFTDTDQVESAHYKFITELAKSSCAAAPAENSP